MHWIVAVKSICVYKLTTLKTEKGVSIYFQNINKVIICFVFCLAMFFFILFNSRMFKQNVSREHVKMLLEAVSYTLFSVYALRWLVIRHNINVSYTNWSIHDDTSKVSKHYNVFYYKHATESAIYSTMYSSAPFRTVKFGAMFGMLYLEYLGF